MVYWEDSLRIESEVQMQFQKEWIYSLLVGFHSIWVTLFLCVGHDKKSMVSQILLRQIYQHPL